MMNRNRYRWVPMPVYKRGSVIPQERERSAGPGYSLYATTSS